MRAEVGHNLLGLPIIQSLRIPCFICNPTLRERADDDDYDDDDDDDGGI